MFTVCPMPVCGLLMLHHACTVPRFSQYSEIKQNSISQTVEVELHIQI